MDYRTELLEYSREIKSFTKRFVGEDEIFLKTEDQAKYKQKVLEVKDLFDEIWGSGNFYSNNLLSTVNNGYGGFFGGPSYASVEEVAALIIAAHKKHSREVENDRDKINIDKSKVFVDPNRIVELSEIKNDKYDLTRLIKLCKEINIATSTDSVLAIAMIARTIINHIPPIFNCKNFTEVANNYNGGKSFKELMLRLDESLRKIADVHLHKQIGASEVLPNYTQVNFAAELDVLLSEIVSLLKK